MRAFLLIILLAFQFNGNSIDTNSIDNQEYKVVGDSVFLQNGTSCHIDRFTNGICEIEGSWWDINYLSFWTGLLIPFAFFGYIVIGIKRKINKRN